jgi:RNA polymerase-binding protein DksA
MESKLARRMGAMAVSHDVLKERLEVEQNRLLSELEQLDVAGRENLGYSTHMADDASAAFDQARDLAIRGSLEQTLKQVQEALDRYAEGKYGICEVCGEPIDPARLKALPHTPNCLDCQRKMER